MRLMNISNSPRVPRGRAAHATLLVHVDASRSHNLHCRAGPQKGSWRAGTRRAVSWPGWRGQGNHRLSCQPGGYRRASACPSCSCQPRDAPPRSSNRDLKPPFPPPSRPFLGFPGVTLNFVSFMNTPNEHGALFPTNLRKEPLI